MTDYTLITNLREALVNSVIYFDTNYYLSQLNFRSFSFVENKPEFHGAIESFNSNARHTLDVDLSTSLGTNSKHTDAIDSDGYNYSEIADKIDKDVLVNWVSNLEVQETNSILQFGLRLRHWYKYLRSVEFNEPNTEIELMSLIQDKLEMSIKNAGSSNGLVHKPNKNKKAYIHLYWGLKCYCFHDACTLDSNYKIVKVVRSFYPNRQFHNICKNKAELEVFKKLMRHFTLSKSRLSYVPKALPPIDLNFLKINSVFQLFDIIKLGEHNLCKVQLNHLQESIKCIEENEDKLLTVDYSKPNKSTKDRQNSIQSQLESTHLQGQLSYRVDTSIVKLSNNEITDVSPLYSILSHICIDVSLTLTWLDLSYNKIEAVPTSLGNFMALKTLYLHNNDIATYDGLHSIALNCLYLQSITLYANPIVEQDPHYRSSMLCILLLSSFSSELFINTGRVAKRRGPTGFKLKTTQVDALNKKHLNNMKSFNAREGKKYLKTLDFNLITLSDIHHAEVYSRRFLSS